jgi:hypothetical protein
METGGPYTATQLSGVSSSKTSATGVYFEPMNIEYFQQRKKTFAFIVSVLTSIQQTLGTNMVIKEDDTQLVVLPGARSEGSEEERSPVLLPFLRPPS